MPPAHLIDEYTLTYSGYEYFKDENKGFSYYGYAPKGKIYAVINKELYDYQRLAWKSEGDVLYRAYMDKDPRLTISSDASVENDRILKISKWNNAYHPALVKLLAKREDDISYEMAEYWVNEYHRNMSYGNHTLEFVNTHSTSHPTPKITWTQIKEYGQLGVLSNFTSEVVESWKDNFRESGNWSLSQTEIHFGRRGRSPKVSFTAYNDWFVDRTRQIGYMTGPSSINAFVPHDIKVQVLRHIFDVYEDLIGCKIYCPKTEGGQIYSMLRDSYLAGKKLIHYDVAGMEIITPSIIQGRTHNFDYGLGMVIGYMGSIPELLSGVGPTSDYDMIAHLELLRVLLKGKTPPDYIIILGDDCTMVSDHDLDLSSPLYERQISDDIMVRTLGLTTHELMHPVGNNFTIDRADKSINLLDNWGKPIRTQMNINERFDIARLFTGYIGETPLHELIGNVKFGEGVYSPKDMMTVIINSSS
jgi:hypothetical protein